MRLAQFDAVLAQRAEIEAGWAALSAARAEDAEWNARLLRHTQASERVNRARLAVDQARLALEAEDRRLSDRQAELGRRVTAGQEQAKALTAAQTILAHMAEQQARRDAIAAELREIGERTAALRSENDRIKTDGQALNEKVEMLQAADTAACPLCRQPLTSEHRDRMLADLAEEHDALAERYRANGSEGKALSERKAALDAEDALLAHDLRARDARQRQAAQAEAVIADGQAAADETVLVARQRADVAARLAAGDYAPSERAELAKAEAELAEIGYDAAAHEAVRARAQELAPFDARYGRQLLPALDGVADARARVEGLAAQLARREAELADDQAEAARLTAAVADLPGLEATLKRAEAAVEGAAATERRARLEEGAAIQQISALSALEARRKLLAADLDRVNEEISVYNQLREAFGKKGLQAMIIESAIPEVEIEANRLLARMSDNRMSLRLETQREKVTGGVAETLDIIISDELGARAYEMFSGGESFRANLALRIAISKLLARRAAGAAAPDAGDRRGLRLTRLTGPVAGGRGDQLDPARFRADYRDHAYRRTERSLPCADRCGEDGEWVAGDDCVTSHEKRVTACAFSPRFTRYWFLVTRHWITGLTNRTSVRILRLSHSGGSHGCSRETQPARRGGPVRRLSGGRAGRDR